ncbi:F-box domain containing protein [Parasponia andersonii]|uniref:F-box domain containing protein n=1 Tax=Parasponia andersonii TaxID=3476 RepID=A0A2P5D7L6_PARAD|nr:F-box domain containing protein [Parasponia andersonii]
MGPLLITKVKAVPIKILPQPIKPLKPKTQLLIFVAMVERRPRRREKTKKKKRLHLGDGAASASASLFMSVIPDDVLLEILIRLPDSKAVIHCGLVCKRWFSGVSRSRLSYFVQKFNHHHRQRRQHNSSDSQLPFTLLMRGSHDASAGPFHSSLADVPCYPFFSDKSRMLRSSPWLSPRCYLDFLGGHILRVLSSFEDLLLLTAGHLKHLWVCNPLTRQLALLPDPPPTHRQNQLYRCGFVCEPNCSCNERLGEVSPCSYYCNCSIKYRVALIHMDESDLVFHAAVFSSEAGKWTKSTFMFSVRLHLWHFTPVGCNGIIYWLLFENNKYEGIAAFDPFKGTGGGLQQCRLIGLPVEFGRGWRNKGDNKACLGVVLGRLRLCQFYRDKRVYSFVLKAWELDATASSSSTSSSSSSSSWDLIHHVRLEEAQRMSLFLIALHSEDGDAFFFTHVVGSDRDICQCKIGRENFEHVCEFPKFKEDTGPDLCVFTLVHPWWPTTNVQPWWPSLRTLS